MVAQAGFAFVEFALLAHHGAVVRREDDERIVHQVPLMERGEKMADPGIYERDFAGIGGLDALPLVVGEAVGCPPRGNAIVAVVVFVVHLCIVHGRVPRLVRIKAVHVEEERIVEGVVIHPVGGSGHDLRHGGVSIALPVLAQHQVLDDPVVRSDLVRRHRQLLEHLHDLLLVAESVHIAFLAADPVPVVEAPVKVLARLHHVIDIRDEAVAVALLAQPLGGAHVLIEERVPAVVDHGVTRLMDVAGRGYRASGENRAPRRKRWQALGIGIHEDGAL